MTISNNYTVCELESQNEIHVIGVKEALNNLELQSIAESLNRVVKEIIEYDVLSRLNRKSVFKSHSYLIKY